MARFFCAVVDDGAAFSVRVVKTEWDNEYSVDYLKETIRAAMSKRIECDAVDLRLFVANKKKGDTDAWLEGTGLGAAALDGASVVPLILDEYGNRQNCVQMDSTLDVKNDKYCGTGFQPEEGQIHGLVMVSMSLSTPVSGEMDIHRNLDRLGVWFSTRELKFLLNRGATKYGMLMSTALTSAEADTILAFARSAIKSAAHNAIALREGILLDRPINLCQGQAKSAVYYAYSRSGGVLVAKVYGR